MFSLKGVALKPTYIFCLDAKKYAKKAVKNRLCPSSLQARKFWRFQPFSRSFFEWDGRTSTPLSDHSLDLFCLLFCVKTKRVRLP